MLRISQVLCPIDFSEFSRRAVDHAAAVAHSYEARLTVLHVFPNMPVMDVPPLRLADEQRERLLADMRRFTAPVPSDVPVDIRIQEAPDVHGEILAQAAAIHADLLVMGSHGRSGFERLFLGSVTEKVMRKAPCPVMIVPRRAPDRAPDQPVQFRRILCPMDFSDGSLFALELALEMAEEADGKLTVLHVVELPPALSESPAIAGLDVAAIETERLSRLRELIPREAHDYCSAEAAVREGAAYREILKVAAQRDVDLIVMGVEGRGAIDLMAFGSNTARVTRGAACPVLIVRPGMGATV